MGSYKQLSSALKTKIIEAYKTGEGYKKLAKRFQLAVSSVRNVVKKWQLTGTVEVKMRPGRPRKKTSERNDSSITVKANQTPMKETDQEDFTDVINTLNLQTFSQPSTVVGSYKQLPNALKVEIIDGHKAGEGYKKLAKRFQVAASSVRNVIKKWQLTGMVVKFRPGRPKKLSERPANRTTQKANPNPSLTVNKLPEAFRDSRTTDLKKKCVDLTTQIMDKIFVTDDQDTLEELSGKLTTLLENLTPPTSNGYGIPLCL